MYNFSITDAVVARILALRSIENREKLNFRISVDGGGCSGFKYVFSLDDAPKADDIVISKGDVSVFIDEISMEMLKDCTLDYVEDLGGAGFVVKNPNATAKCGCGSSFAV
jgi:iron-sulfur cluster insertion protein